jgi:hypothetical protein
VRYVHVLIDLGHAFREGFFMFWATLSALVLGFALSGAVHALVSRPEMQLVLVRRGGAGEDALPCGADVPLLLGPVPRALRGSPGALRRASARAGQVVAPNQRARRVGANDFLSAARASFGPTTCAVGDGPPRKFASTFATRPPPNSM